MKKTRTATKDVDVGRCIFNPERKSWIVGGHEYELTSKDHETLRQLTIKYADNDTDVISTKAELLEEIPTFLQATALTKDD